MNRQSFLALGLLAFAAISAASAADLRIGMIGLDTSHVPAFTDILNNPQNKAHVPGAKVVAAFKGGSQDIPSSRDRVEGFTKTLVEKYGVKLYDSVEELVKHVDAVFIESVVHGCETLFTVMGTGCESVKRGTTADGKIEVTGKWKGGRTGIFREAKGYTGIAKGDKGEVPIGAYDGYAPLVAEAIKAFQTGNVPVKPEETIELFAFMEAADESKRRGGAEVTLAEVLKKAGAK